MCVDVMLALVVEIEAVFINGKFLKLYSRFVLIPTLAIYCSLHCDCMTSGDHGSLEIAAHVLDVVVAGVTWHTPAPSTPYSAW